MKKKFPKNSLTFSFLLCIALFFRGAICVADENLDRQYMLETIGTLRATDNVDGLFADYVTAAYKDYFSHQTRFALADLSRADELMNRSKLDYGKLIQDKDILSQVARSTRIQSILRTKILKQGSQYLFTLEWLHVPQMELMSTVQFTLEEPEGESIQVGDTLPLSLQTNLDKLFAHVPFIGNVTGRDGNSVTLNLGRNSQIRKGDTLIISTLNDVRKHPLLKTIVDWRFVPTGTVEIEQVEDSLAFGKIIEEEAGREVGRFQKVTEILHPTTPYESTQALERGEPASDLHAPLLGWAGTTLLLGTHNWQYSSGSGASGNVGGGLALGGKAEGELWFNQNWFADLEFKYAFWSFSQQSIVTGADTLASQAGGVSGSLSGIKLNLGYSKLVRGDLFGPKIWGKLGVKTSSYGLPTSTSEVTGSVSFKSLFVGVGGDLPILERWGAFTNLNFRIFSLADASWVPSPVSSSSDIEFFFGGYYRHSPSLTLRGGIEILATSLDFASGTTLSQKTITIGPSVLYYF